jgi:hypothetical protein
MDLREEVKSSIVALKRLRDEYQDEADLLSRYSKKSSCRPIWDRKQMISRIEKVLLVWEDALDQMESHPEVDYIYTDAVRDDLQNQFPDVELWPLNAFYLNEFYGEADKFRKISDDWRLFKQQYPVEVLNLVSTYDAELVRNVEGVGEDAFVCLLYLKYGKFKLIPEKIELNSS